MNKKILSLAVAVIAATLFFACKSGINSSDVVASINGPNSIKGTISGTMMNDTAYSFAYDYHVTSNDGNSASESWIDNSTGDTLGNVWQYFYFNRNGYDDYGDNWSADGQYMYLYFEFQKTTVNKVTKLVWRTLADEPYQYVHGMWQKITDKGNRFVYGTMRYYGYQSYTTPPTWSISDLSYNSATQILSGKINFALAEGNDVQINSGNHHATTITGNFNIYYPKENFQVVKKSNSWGQVFRAR